MSLKNHRDRGAGLVLAFQWVILGVLLAHSFEAMAYLPFGSGEVSVWSMDYTLDPLYPRRCYLIALGISYGFMNLFLLGVLICFERTIHSFLAAFAVSLSTSLIGFCMFPYWVNGVYGRDIGRVEWRDMDPKALSPTGWPTDGLLDLLQLFSCLMAYPAIPMLCFFTILVRRNKPVHVLSILASTTILGAALVSAPNYLNWFMD